MCWPTAAFPAASARRSNSPACNAITLDDSELRGALLIEASQPVRLEARPHRTVSQSEAGFEKIMQAVCITLAWSPAAGSSSASRCRVVPAS
jgi:hypothetical protein